MACPIIGLCGEPVVNLYDVEELDTMLEKIDKRITHLEKGDCDARSACWFPRLSASTYPEDHVKVRARTSRENEEGGEWGRRQKTEHTLDQEA